MRYRRISVPLLQSLLLLHLLLQTHSHTAHAQSLDGVPSCASTCVNNAIPPACNFKLACVCQSDAFAHAISCCVKDSCRKTLYEETQDWANTICNQTGFAPLSFNQTCVNNTSDGSLSVGGKAGIGVGAGLGAVLLFVLAYWLGTRRGSRKSESEVPQERRSPWFEMPWKLSFRQEQHPGHSEEVKPPYELSSAGSRTKRVEKTVPELEAGDDVAELEGDIRHRAELDAQNRHNISAGQEERRS